MKKTLLVAVIACLAASNAAALSFAWSAKTIAFDGTTLKNSEAVTGYLIYLGNNGSLGSTFDISSATTGADVANVIGSKVDEKNKTSAVGKLANSYNFNYGEAPGKNGDVFAMLLTYTNEGTTYFNLSTTTTKLSGLVDDTSGIDAVDFTEGFKFTTAEPSSSLKAGGGWTAVPEPSTAALALAGLALLLKRRKA